LQLKVLSSAKQTGAIAVLVVGSVAALLLITGVTIALLQRSMVKSYAARVADVAALAAISAITLERACGAENESDECTARERWKYSLTLARNAVMESLPASGLIPVGASNLQSLTSEDEDLDGISPLPTTYVTQNSAALSVTIERGRWEPAPRLNQETLFVSFEDRDNWKANFPGLPRTLAFNAVRVTVKVKGVVIPAPFDRILGSSAGFSAQKTSLAMAQRETLVRAAPFAIPVCSLTQRAAGSLDAIEIGSAEFDPKSVCYADRIMGPTSRYCAAATDPECRGVVPQFAWDPVFYTQSPAAAPRYSRTNAQEYWRRTDWQNPTPTLTQYIGAVPPSVPPDNFCFWGSPRYPEPEDNFGIVGIACPSPAERGGSFSVLEASIRNIIWDGANADGLIDSKLGDYFCPLSSGFTEAASQTALAKRITAPSSDLNPNNSQMYLAPATLMYNSNSNYPLNTNQAFKTPETESIHGNCVPFMDPQATTSTSTRRPRWPRAWSRYGPNSNGEIIDSSPTGAPQIEGGTCNSWRLGWGFWDNIRDHYAGRPANQQHYPWYNYYVPTDINPTTNLANVNLTQQSPNDVYDGHLRTLPVWNPWVAVIADLSPTAEPCNGTVTTMVGPDGLVIPRPNQDPKLTLAESGTYQIIGYLKLHVFDLDIGNLPPTRPAASPPFLQLSNSWLYPAPPPPPAPAPPPAPPAPPPAYRWAFNRPDIPAQPNCNLVRTRLSCGQSPLPSLGGSTEIVHPRLVLETPVSEG